MPRIQLSVDPHRDAMDSTASQASAGLSDAECCANDAHGRNVTSHYAIDTITVP